jgi:ADP-ribose pyrophosphatase YjhB (NUDIX family)
MSVDEIKMTERVIRVGTRAVIFNEDNELLVEHNVRPEVNYYYLPGSGVWFHEKIEDCLVREVKEETGLEVKAERLLWVRDFIEGLPDPHGIEIFFLATITGGKFRPVHDTAPLEFSFMEVEKLERIRFYPKSFIPKLKKLRDNRKWSETNPYMKSAP